MLCECCNIVGWAGAYDFTVNRSKCCRFCPTCQLSLLKWHSWLHQDARLTLMTNSTLGRRHPFTLNEGNGKSEKANSTNATVSTCVTTMTSLQQYHPTSKAEKSLCSKSLSKTKLITVEPIRPIREGWIELIIAEVSNDCNSWKRRALKIFEKTGKGLKVTEFVSIAGKLVLACQVSRFHPHDWIGESD